MHSYFIFLNKPIGFSSQQCLTQFKRKYSVRKSINSIKSIKKIGHHGTLDPFASGLLLVGVNEATKFFQFINDEKKSYTATLWLGTKTDTLDNTGKILDVQKVPSLDSEQIQKVFSSFFGKIKQTPPMYSAIKQDGKKLYELARSGIEVEREERQVEIFDLKLLSWETPFLKISVTVSRGTYIRVLAEQIAEKLSTCAHLTELVRTHLCGQDLSVGFEISQNEEIPTNKKIPIETLLNHHQKIELDEKLMTDLFHGKKLEVQNRHSSHPDLKYLAFYKEKFLGVCHSIDGNLVSQRLMDLRPELLK